MIRMRSFPSLVAMSLLAVACAKAKESQPAEPPPPKPVDPAPARPADPSPAAPTAGGAAAPATGPITFDEIPDDASCVKFVPKRGGAAMTLPKDIADALECPATAPEVLPGGDGFVYVRGHELLFWKPIDPPRRLVLFEAPDDDSFSTSQPVWSPDGTKLALVSMSSSYPDKTRLFVLTIDAAGAVTGKVKHDVRVFSPCGSVCRPVSPEWKGPNAVEVTDYTDEGAPGEKHLFKL